MKEDKVKITDVSGSDWFTKLGWFVAGVLVGALVTALAFRMATPARAVAQIVQDGCNHNCPVVHFEWTTREVDVEAHYIYAEKEIDVAGHYGDCPNGYSVYASDSTKCRKNTGNHEIINRPYVDTTYKCPSGYSSNPGHDNCRKWVDTTYKDVNHSADVAYEKSDDPTKCHRPSDSTLTNTYGMDHDARDAFKKDNAEWKDSIKSAPEGYYIADDGTCKKISVECPENATTNSDGVCVCNPGFHEVANEGEDSIKNDFTCQADPTPPSSGGSSPDLSTPFHQPEAPVCADLSTINLPANIHVARAGSDATVTFFITEGDSAKIYYSQVGQPHWQYAVSDVKGNADNYVSFTIHDLDANVGYDFGIQQVRGCSGGQIATGVVVDGPNATTFGLTYWTF